ncbi:TssQ family T6SS-associated lipoprotein [Halopseudomonas salegens]|uniref:Uncharacterized protein n=1 Tax=Halopseudomonas salegens TaxID=1434072 RepID=A0A1H2E095_9GAMM|nr:TssQ family T6SS-associated lipoprotein [Halopseudomonas salegens]SDT88536.1 hypothetical protein SAMN05216210_0178 [Halopseudomonas salegens]
MKRSIQNFALTGMLAILLTGCLATGPTVAPPLTAEEIARQRASQSLDDALALYEKGYYQQAEHRLLSEDIWRGSNQTQQSALKHLAFIYCISDRKQMCRHAFERAIHINQNFTLSSAEATHPLWGPEYQLARTGKQN